MTKMFIHAVVNRNGTFTCTHPECQFSTTDLTKVAEHTVTNQFVVVDPPKKKAAPLFKI